MTLSATLAAAAGPSGHNRGVTDLEALPTLVTHGPLADRIRDVLRTAITTGALPPGFRLRENHLAEHFDCSSTPVREAVRRLEGDGLVRILPRRGAEVVGFDQQALVELFEVREVLELAAARLAAERHLDRAALAEVRGLIVQQESLSHDEPAAQRLNTDIHAAIARLSGNHQLAGLVERVNNQIDAARARLGNSVRHGVRHATKAHRAWLGAAASRTPERAVGILADHLSSAREAVLESGRTPDEAATRR